MLSLLHGGAHAIIFIYLFFPAERAYATVIFACAFCRLMQSPWMERVTTMNQLTDIWPKQVVIIIIFIWIIKSLYRRISNVYEECGSIIVLSLLHGGAHAIIFIYLFFPAERAYATVIFACAFCRLMQSPWMERVTTMNQLTDIRNKSAESLKTN